MFCPRCSQEQVSDEIRFCSRCGFSLSVVSLLLHSNGELIAEEDSPRKRGLRQGLLIFLLGFLIVPLLTVISILIRTETPAAVIIAAILFGGGGILRMIYARLAESNVKRTKLPQQRSLANFESARSIPFLEPGEVIPAKDQLLNDTDHRRATEKFGPHSVTEKTTELFERK